MAVISGSNQKPPKETRTKVAIVTGGSSGIGLELCKLLRENYVTYSLDNHDPQERLDGVKHISCNIAAQPSVQLALGQINKPINLLVNNAGILRRGSITKMDVQPFYNLIMTNICGTWLMTREAWKSLVPNATVLFMSSERAIYPRNEVEVYGLTKLFIMKMAHQISQNNPQIKIKVALPGPVNTPMLKNDLGKSRYKEIARMAISPSDFAGLVTRLLDSEYELLRYDDPREEKSGQSGRYVLENFEQTGKPVIVG